MALFVHDGSPTMEEHCKFNEFTVCPECWEPYEAACKRGEQGLSFHMILKYAPPSEQPCEHLRKYVAELLAAGKCTGTFKAMCEALPQP